MGLKRRISELNEALVLEKPYFFFGPCSAESFDQLHQTAKGISESFVDPIFRAGIWKPRTRPNTFEGVGVEGLKWLSAIKEEFGFRIATEVATAKHVEACLKAEVDIVWIGARTTVNPFSVQEIVEGLKGTGLTVFVKNPIYPDISLWMGAVERVEKAGIEKFGAIHRGFQLQDNGPYRNNPYWDLAIRMRSMYPNIPIISDISHIAGKPSLLQHVAQKAIDLDMDGLMVETHFNPKEALSDSEQQITPSELRELIRQLTPKSQASTNVAFQSKLERLREQIDSIDDDLLERLAVRMELAKQIGLDKRLNQVTILQVERWRKTMERSIKNGESLGLSKNFIEGMLHLIHDESIRKQTENIDDEPNS